MSHASEPAAEAITRIFTIASGMLVARCLHVVTDLGVADHLGDSPETAETLAAKVGGDAESLRRMLRLIANAGLFEETEDGRFAHSSLSRYLRSDHERSQRAWVSVVGAKMLWDSMRELEHTARTGEAAVFKLDPPGLFPYMAANPESAAKFDAGMASKAQADIASIMGAYDFSGFTTVADIGGGRGHLLQAVLAAAPSARGVLFDQPQVVARAQGSDRLSVVGGDFFKTPLPSADGYILMNVIHDWDDEESIAILTAVCKAAQPGARLLLIELILPERSGSAFALMMDVAMLAYTGGRERKASEYQALFTASGWDLQRIVPTDSGISIMELAPA